MSLAYFSFENHEVIFPIEIRRLSVPVLFDPGKGELKYSYLHCKKIYEWMLIIICDISGKYKQFLKQKNMAAF